MMNEAMGCYVVCVVAMLTASSCLAPRELASDGMQAGQAALQQHARLAHDVLAGVPDGEAGEGRHGDGLQRQV